MMGHTISVDPTLDTQKLIGQPYQSPAILLLTMPEGVRDEVDAIRLPCFEESLVTKIVQRGERHSFSPRHYHTPLSSLCRRDGQ